jgi:uncharacterized protein YidB (DUF937 family)
MRLVDEMAGALRQQPGAPPGGFDANALVQQVVGLLGNQPGSALGGLGRLMTAFEQRGLAAVFQSWVGMGPNLTVSPEQLQDVLGSGRIAQIAQALRLDDRQVAAALTQVLPLVVDKLTPHGHLPLAGGTPDFGEGAPHVPPPR